MRRGFFAELKRRNVIRMAGLYLVAAWLTLQVFSTLLPVFEAPGWVMKALVAALVMGFVAALGFAWIYEITPEGIKRESDVERVESITPQTGRRMDRAIIVVLALALVAFAVDRFVFVPRREAANAVPVAAPSQSSATHAPADAAQSATVSEKSIAVLPFVNMSDDKGNEFFSDGISEELLNLLAKIPELQVTARTSSFSFKGREIGIREIAKTLGVAHILEGSVRKSGNQVRITAQLINALNDKHLWSETYDRKLDDIFKVQDEIAGKVVEELKVTLLGAAPKARATDPRAYALYLQAVQLSRQASPDSFPKSDDLFRQVLAIDAHYVPAWSGLATNAFNETSSGMLSPSTGFARGREAVNKALEIDPEYAQAHAQLGFAAMYDTDDLTAASKHFERALTLAPADLDVLRTAALLLSNLGRVDEALAVSAAIARRDPVNVTLLSNMGYEQRIAGHYDDAIATQRTVLNLSPNRGSTHFQVGVTLLMKGDAAGALAEIEQETSAVYRLMGLPLAYDALGRKADSDQALAAFIGQYEKDAAYNIAYVYAYRGEPDKAFEWLDRAVQYEDPGLSEIVAEQLFDKIRKDPRWLPFLRKIHKDPETLAKVEFKVTLPKEWQADAAN